MDRTNKIFIQEQVG